MPDDNIYASSPSSGGSAAASEFVPMDTDLGPRAKQQASSWRVTGDLVIAVATLLDLLALVAPVFCSSNQCWAVTSYLDGGMLHMLGWLFAFPLGCFVVHATVPLAVLLLARARKQPPPEAQPQNGLQDCMLLTLAAASLLSTLGVVGFLLTGTDAIFGGPNQLGGTGTYSASVAMFMFAFSGVAQAAGFCLRAREVGLLPRGSRRLPPPALPFPFAELTVAPWLGCVVYFLVMLLGGSSECAPVKLDTLSIPDGVKLEFFSPVGATPNGRSLFLGPPHAASGAPYTVFIGSGGMSDMDKVYGLLPDPAGGSATASVIAEGLSHPNGVAADWTVCTTDAQCTAAGSSCDTAQGICDDSVLYVAEWSRVLRWPLASALSALDGSGDKLTVGPDNVYVDNLPTADGGHHAWKFLGVGPDGALYVPVGSPCNICVVDSYGNPIDDQSVFGSILRVPPGGGGKYDQSWKYAYGIRNTVGFDWHPVTRELYFTDNGADWMGDDIPPDELNRVTEPGLPEPGNPGQHFGFPWCYGVSNERYPGFTDETHSADMSCVPTYTPAIAALPAHGAALGMRFYAPPGTAQRKTERMGFSAAAFEAGRLPGMENQILVAEHGSWNRRKLSGYQVQKISLDAQTGDGPYEVSSWVSGWASGADVCGRPADVLVAPDGSVLISDELGGVVLRATKA